MTFNNEKIIYLEDKDFTSEGHFSNSIDTTKPILVMIYGNNCPHCHQAMPDFIELSKQMFKDSSAFLAVIEIDGPRTDSKLASRLSSFIPNLKGVPTFVLFRNGRYIKTHQGPRTKQALQKFIQT